jgi:hypothetical protein
MPSVDEQIAAAAQADQKSATWRLWARRAGVTVLTAVPVVALFNVVGQRATTTTRDSPDVTVSVRAPSAVRPGLLFQAKVTVTARRTLPKATLSLGNGWFDGMTMNTNEPSASSETSLPGGGVSLSLGTLQPDQPYVQYFEFQVNPTSWGRRSQLVEVDSDSVSLVRIDHKMTVVP